jgi:hypothetical protein
VSENPTGRRCPSVVLLRFPELKTEEGAVADRLSAVQATEVVLAAWKKLVAEEILPDDDDSGY